MPAAAFSRSSFTAAPARPRPVQPRGPAPPVPPAPGGADWPFGRFQPGAYDVIVADPPWKFRLWGPHDQRKSARAHYELMDLPAIKAMPVRQLARPNTMLLLWASECMRPQAHEVMAAWGFSYRSAVVWLKRTRSGASRIGTGYWARGMHEPVLIGRVGRPRALRLPSAFDGLAREHSRKPDEFYALLRERTPGARRIDLFGGGPRAGFDVWEGKPRFAAPLRRAA